MIKHFLPETNTTFQRAQVAVVIFACLGLATASALLVLFWIVSASLTDIETPFIALAFIAILLTLASLARKNKVCLAGGLLTLLILALILANTIAYGIATSSTAALLIPIILAFFLFSAMVGWGLTFLSVLSLWLISLAASAGMLQTEIPFEVFALTFHAPALTLIFLLVAGILHTWLSFSRAEK